MMDYSLNNPKRLGAKKQLEFWSKTILSHEQGALRRIGSRCLDKLGNQR